MFKDVFAWSYKKLKGIPRSISKHKIELTVDARPIKQQPYRMNPNYAQRVKEDLDKLLDAQFIFPIEITQRLSPLVIVPKKNDKLRICVDYQKLNSQTKKNPVPLPFLDSILDTMARHDMYSFMDGYNGYNKVKMVKENKKKTTFISKGGTYAYNVLPFGLCNVQTTFQKVVT
jgi:hypothetical protein